MKNIKWLTIGFGFIAFFVSSIVCATDHVKKTFTPKEIEDAEAQCLKIKNILNSIVNMEKSFDDLTADEHNFVTRYRIDLATPIEVVVFTSLRKNKDTPEDVQKNHLLVRYFCKGTSLDEIEEDPNACTFGELMNVFDGEQYVSLGLVEKRFKKKDDKPSAGAKVTVYRTTNLLVNGIPMSESDYKKLTGKNLSSIFPHADE